MKIRDKVFLHVLVFLLLQSVWAEEIGGREHECSSQDFKVLVWLAGMKIQMLQGNWSLSAYISTTNETCSQEIKHKVKCDFEVLNSKDHQRDVANQQSKTVIFWIERWRGHVDQVGEPLKYIASQEREKVYLFKFLGSYLN